jgi:hypothetical protein
MRGEPYRRCFCRDPVTRKPLGRKCPKLGKAKGHGAWFFRYDAPRGPDGKIDVKPSTLVAIREAIELYWVPALGHLRLVDLRDHHIAEAIRAMMQINQPPTPGERPSEMLRRLLDARADDERRELPPGEKRRKKSTKPLSPARVKRVFAVLSAAMNAAVPGKIAVSPCIRVNLPRVKRVRPLPWTPARESAYWPCSTAGCVTCRS